MENPSCSSVGELFCVRRNGHFWDWRSNPHWQNCLDFIEDCMFGLAYLGRAWETAAVHILWHVQWWVKLKDSQDPLEWKNVKLEAPTYAIFFLSGRPCIIFEYISYLISGQRNKHNRCPIFRFTLSWAVTQRNPTTSPRHDVKDRLNFNVKQILELTRFLHNCKAKWSACK